ncbi:hypothetical protein HN415_09755 [Candidatus Woesearchaeota archaeon]|jgi:hypothetical protein|nr:hypothetical protein [Candidatus Woesearchaeota archaeon]
MEENIRIKKFLDNSDIVNLNFINSDSPYVFRRHIYHGLRSHIFQMVKKTDVEYETKGKMIDGIKFFPNSKPVGLLRIYRAAFSSYNEIKKESNKIKLLEKYLSEENMAKSQEFVVNYKCNGNYEILLCGVQRYVDGNNIDPWSDNYYDISKEKGKIFILKIKNLIYNESLIPDLSGYRNILKDSDNNFVLVDINNVLKVNVNSEIHLDSTGYPSVDKSVEALSLLEEKIVGKKNNFEFIYNYFLRKDRMNEVNSIEKLWKLNYEKQQDGYVFNRT